MPKKEPIVMKAADKVLAKTIDYTFEPSALPRDMFNYEDAVDLPAFLRKSRLKEL
jgi:hypothetical protein